MELANNIENNLSISSDVTLEKQKGFYVSNIINYIYLKEKDNSVNSYQNANIKIKVKLEEKERNNYD